MKITKLTIDVIGDGDKVDPDLGGIEPLPLLTVHTDQGINGFSEMFRVPPGVARATLVGEDSFLGSQVIDTEIIHPEAIWNRLYDNMLHSNRRGWVIRCLGALDIALWDIVGKAATRPVYELLGGHERNPFQTNPRKINYATHITPYCTIVSDNWEPKTVLSQQIERCEKLAELGYLAFKVEPMHSTKETAVELVKQARSALGPEKMLALDVGYGYNDHATALWIAQRVEEYDVAFFETPFAVDTTGAYKRLSSMTPVPLAMGEHAATRFEFLDMMDNGGVTVCQPYASNCGGLTEAKRIVDLAKERTVSVVPGNWSTQILGMANNHLAAYSPITPWVEYAAAEIYVSGLRSELQALSPKIRNGILPIPTKPGIGVEVPEDLINHYRLNL